MSLRLTLHAVVASSYAAALIFIAGAMIPRAHAQESNTVTIEHFHFAPMSMTIASGTTVTWKNLDEEPHTVASVNGVFRSGALDENDGFSFKFDKPGTYDYFCSIHPMMAGTIIVK